MPVLRRQVLNWKRIANRLSWNTDNLNESNLIRLIKCTVPFSKKAGIYDTVHFNIILLAF